MNDLELAELSLLGKTDLLGFPIIQHCVRVAARVAIRTHDHDVIHAALWHEMLEDGTISIEGRASERVINLVKAVSRNPVNESYGQYVTRIIAAGQDAILIKLCDIADHLDPSRIACLLQVQDTTTVTARVKKYQKARKRLIEAYHGDRTAI